jgi:electron transport complex protein RnfA
MEYLLLLIGSILVNNFVMSQFLGICPFLGVSKKLETALGMGMAVTFVMALASLICYLIYTFLLIPLGLEYLYTIAFILVIGVLVQVVEMALGVYLPLITTNCAVLGVTVLNMTKSYNLLQSVVNGTGSALGFTLAIVLFAAIRERLAVSKMPKWMDGFPGALITAGLMAISFLGFKGLIK